MSHDAHKYDGYGEGICGRCGAAKAHRIHLGTMAYQGWRERERLRLGL